MTQKSGWGKAIVEGIMWSLAGMLLIWTLSGFALGYAWHKAKAETADAMIPLNCLHDIHIIDFRKPCKMDSKNPNMAHCDDVVIHFACVQYKGEGSSHVDSKTP